jgi:hypothetical protein
MDLCSQAFFDKSTRTYEGNKLIGIKSLEDVISLGLFQMKVMMKIICSPILLYAVGRSGHASEKYVL